MLNCGIQDMEQGRHALHQADVALRDSGDPTELTQQQQPCVNLPYNFIRPYSNYHFHVYWMCLVHCTQMSVALAVLGLTPAEYCKLLRK
jgi:hypothetical protein